MAIKNVCSIPLNWTLDEYSKHTCSDGSHNHLSRSQVREREAAGRVVWLIEGKSRHENSAAFILPELNFQVTNTPRCPAMNTGLSYRVGEVLALAIYKRRPWALAMHADIRMKRETPEPVL